LNGALQTGTKEIDDEYGIQREDELDDDLAAGAGNAAADTTKQENAVQEFASNDNSDKAVVWRNNQKDVNRDTFGGPEESMHQPHVVTEWSDDVDYMKLMKPDKLSYRNINIIQALHFFRRSLMEYIRLTFWVLAKSNSMS